MLDSAFFSSTFGMAVLLFGLILAILWCFLPFAIFGIKDKLSAILEESRNNTAHLKVVIEELRIARGAGTPAAK